ncbi:MAG TPA: acyl-CoA dehydratase activase-related protein, partial [Verrucomicrobiae bacterium]|nr:acyl-CoA dehydratase activase-related protein [Verrucomicrobiae bacterium]
KAIVHAGLEQAVDETCLPVKVYMGHVLSLLDKVDYLFVPRLVSLEEKHFNCPKFIGLPDMVRGCMPNLPQVLEVTVDVTDNPSLARKTLLELGAKFGASASQTQHAYEQGLKAYRRYRDLLKTGLKHEQAMVEQDPESLEIGDNKGDKIAVALLGHPYNVCDPWVGGNVAGILESMGIGVLLADRLPMGYLRQKAQEMSQHIFWTFEKKLAGAAVHYAQAQEVDGIILVAAFECGPDSLVAELIEREVRDKIPIMTLFIDEHTGEAGLVTRLEAFADMVQWRKSGKEIAAAVEDGEEK